MAFTIVTKDWKNNIYVAAYRELPIFEIGITVPEMHYYVQFINNQYQIFDTAFKPAKLITFGDIMELAEDKIAAITDTITVMNKIMNEI